MSKLIELTNTDDDTPVWIDPCAEGLQLRVSMYYSKKQTMRHGVLMTNPSIDCTAVFTHCGSITVKEPIADVAAMVNEARARG